MRKLNLQTVECSSDSVVYQTKVLPSPVNSHEEKDTNSFQGDKALEKFMPSFGEVISIVVHANDLS